MNTLNQDWLDQARDEGGAWVHIGTEPPVWVSADRIGFMDPDQQASEGGA